MLQDIEHRYLVALLVALVLPLLTSTLLIIWNEWRWPAVLLRVVLIPGVALVTAGRAAQLGVEGVNLGLKEYDARVSRGDEPPLKRGRCHRTEWTTAWQ